MKRGHLKWYIVAAVGIFVIYTIKALISVPGDISRRIVANQAAALGTLRTINTAEVTYSGMYNCGYSPSLAALGPASSGNASAAASGLVDNTIAGGTYSGYRFSYTASGADSKGCYKHFTVTANPVRLGYTGQQYYFMDDTGVVRWNSEREASATDSPMASDSRP